jgi:DNA (cytosine-5)-methyltransferase 1
MIVCAQKERHDRSVQDPRTPLAESLVVSEAINASPRGRYVEVCAGAGGLGLGLHAAGWTGTGIELDADASETHRRHVGPCLTADVTTCATPHSADLVGGGVPCQSYSTNGKREGLNDPRGQLFRALLRHAVEANARAVVLENVRGLISCGALPVILSAFRAAGFEPVHALLNACDFGVPQNRVRLFIAGFRTADDLARFRWPQPTHGAPGNLYRLPPWRTVRDALGFAGEAGSTRIDRPSPCLTASEGKSALRFGSQGAKTGARRAGDRLNPLFAAIEPGRRITVADAKALQGFPAAMEFVGDGESQFKQIGNAVAPAMGEAIGRSLWTALYGAPQPT